MNPYENDCEARCPVCHAEYHPCDCPAEVEEKGATAMNQPRVTIKKVNTALPEGYELVKGNGYFYFTGPDCHEWYTSSVPVCHLNDLTVERWVEEFNDLRTNKDDATQTAALKKS
jgi:hypothetical protein